MLAMRYGNISTNESTPLFKFFIVIENVVIPFTKRPIAFAKLNSIPRRLRAGIKTSDEPSPITPKSVEKTNVKLK